ncbi:MAG: Trm112 family protein [Lentisphaeria bacterium]|nr:Trm112 family protein [Lentisphaeria bacterium]
MSRRPPQELITILACPACSDRPPVRLSEDGTWVICDQCRRQYPVKDGIPVMLVDEAVTPSPTPIINNQ